MLSNNPTGQLISEVLLEKIVRKAEVLNIVVVIDESFWSLCLMLMMEKHY